MSNFQKFVFTPHPEDAEMRTTSFCIDYMNTNNKFTATYSDGKFHHYQNGDKDKTHDDTYLAFDTEQGTINWMEIRDGKIYVGPDKNSMHPGTMVYKGWDGKIWSADLVREIDFHPELTK